MKRHEVTDDQWAVVGPLIPRKAARAGRRPRDPRMMLNGMLWILRTGAPWRDLPERLGPWQTVYDYFRCWRSAGVFDRILQALQIRLDREGKIDWDLWCVDGSNVRAARALAALTKSLAFHADEPEDHALGRSRGGFGSKFHLVTDGHGLPLAGEITAGQVHESTQVGSVMDQIAIAQPVGRPRKRPRRLAGDKGYSYSRVRDWLRAHGIKPVIPQRADQRARHRGIPIDFDPKAYRRRSIIECCVGWLKECRRIATRFEKLAVNFLGMLKLAMIERYLRMTQFSDRA